MNSREDQENEIEPAMAEALDWLVRLKSGAATTADARALAVWRARSPRHEEAFQEIATYREMTLALPPTASPAPGVLPFQRRSVSRRAILTGGATAVAASAAVMLVQPPLGLWPSLAELMSDHRTAPGERYAFEPTPGVEVEMNTRTSLSLADAGNGIRILDGETFVTVAKRPTTFSVAAGNRRVAASGASFNIRVLNGDFCVACVTGRVTAARDGIETALGAGEQLIYTAGGAALRSKVNPALATAWRHGLLIFNGTPLSDVVAEINRYRPGRIILSDSAVGTRPVNGVFHTGHIENTVAQIQQLLGVSITHLPGGVVLMG